MILILLISGYISGSIPFAVVVSRLKGVDICKVGTGNPGAANVYREVGKRYGILVWILDTAKGILPMIIAGILKQPLIVIAATGSAAIVGHCFSLFLKLKGGKGVATMGGVTIYLFPLLFPIGAFLYFWVQRRKRKPSIIYIAFLIFFAVAFIFHYLQIITFHQRFYLQPRGFEIILSMLLLLTVAMIANISTVKEVKELWSKKN